MNTLGLSISISSHSEVGVPRELVTGEVHLAAGAVVTVRTRKRLLPSVHPRVRRQIALLVRAVVTEVALEAFHPRVHQHVRDEVVLPSKAHGTLCAEVWLDVLHSSVVFLLVPKHVCSAVCRVTKQDRMEQSKDRW
jgi:hypothetical protein